MLHALHRNCAFLVASILGPITLAQDALLAEARGHLEQGDVAAAAAAARLSMREKKTGEACYIIGHAQLVANEADSARKSFEEALKLDEHQHDAIFELGLALDDLGEHKKAVKEFQRYAALHPEDPRGLVQEAYVRLNSLDDAAGAKRILDSCSVRFPSASAVLYYQAIASKKLGHDEEAFAWLDKGAAAHPQDPDFPFQRGRWLCDADRFKEAEPQLAKALELEPSTRRARWWAWCRMMATTGEDLWKRVDGEVRLSADWLGDAKEMDALVAKGARYDYAELSKRFLAGDTMGLDEVFLFYYGQTAAEDYSPYGDPAETEMDVMLEKGDVKSAVDWAAGHVKDHPACLEAWRSMSYACSSMDGALCQQAAVNYDLLLNAITASGSGKSMDEAIWVACVHDEYIIIGYEGLRRGSQALVRGGKYNYDLLECTNADGKDVKRYFNITKPFNSLGKMFKEK